MMSCWLTSAIPWWICRRACCAPRCGAGIPACTGSRRSSATTRPSSDTLVGAYSRFVLVGADGIRLHEEVLYAGGWLREDGRSAAWRAWRAPRHAGPGAHHGHASGAGHPGPAGRAVAQARDALLAGHRAADRRADRVLACQAGRPPGGRAPPDRHRLKRFAASLRKALAEERRGGRRLFSVAEGRGDDGRSPSSAATARNGRKNSSGLDAAGTTRSSASAPVTATSGRTASRSR